MLCCRSDRVYLECGAFCTEQQNGICAPYSAVAFRLGIMKYPEGETQRGLEEEWCMSLISG